MYLTQSSSATSDVVTSHVLRVVEATVSSSNGINSADERAGKGPLQL
jgi:hypothetical protein